MGNLIELINKKDLSSLGPFVPQSELEIIACFFYFIEDFPFGGTQTLVPLDDDCHTFQCSEICLMFNEVLDPGVVISNQNGVVLPHHI